MKIATRRAGTALVAAVVGSLALTACGGSADPTPTATASATANPDQTEEASAAAPEAPSEITVTHAQGETVVPVNPSRVITFDYASLGTLDAIGVDIIGLPQASVPDSLSAYDSADYANVGTLFEPDFEAVNALEPDLIIVAGRSSQQLPALSEIAPTIDLSNDWADFTGSAITNAEILGEIFDKEAEVAQLVAEVHEAVAGFDGRAEQIGSVLFLMTSGGSANAYGPGSRFGWIYDDLGLIPAIEDVEEATHGEAISWELVLETNPDWLLVIDRDTAIGEDAASAQEILDNELVRQTTAWTEGQVAYLDAETWYVINGGIVPLLDMIAEVDSAVSGN